MPQLPSGTVTFVFSDVEGSTSLLKQLGDAGYAEVLATHRRLVREIFAAHDGHEIDTQGDAFFYSFTRARAAVAAAVAIQRAHAREPWPGGVAVRIRLGLHTGEPAVGEEGYTGLDVVRASRIAAVGRGGQVLLSETTCAIVADDLPDGVTMRWLGETALKDIERPEPLHELIISDIPRPEELPPSAASGDAPILDLATLPGVAVAQQQLPGWLRDTAQRFLPGGADASRLIEERVLAEIEQSFNEQPVRRRRRKQRPAAAADQPEQSASLADEIAKLQRLHDAGALTDEQYDRAVERAIGGRG
jgi:class 3 adenylate cyclase